MMGFGGIVGILLIVVIAWAVMQLAGNKGSGNPFTPSGQGPQADKSDALEILKQRYARGEISKEEFNEKKKEL